MKTAFRRIIAIFAIVAVSGLSAAGLERFVPGDSELLVMLDVKPVADHQEVSRFLNSEKGRKAHGLWQNISGLDARKDIEKICLFGNKNQEGGVLFKLKNSGSLISRLDSGKLPEQLSDIGKSYGEKIAFSRILKNGRVLYVFDNDDSGKLALTQIDPAGIWLMARFEYIETALTVPRVSGKDMAAMKRCLPDESYFLRAVWINRSYGKRGKKSGIQDDFKAAAAGIKTGGMNNLDQYYILRLVCANQEQAFMQSMMIPGYLQIGAGMVFSKQPKLAEELFKGFRQKVTGDSVIFTLHVPEKLYAALCGVVVDAARGSLVAPYPVPDDIKTGKK